MSKPNYGEPLVTKTIKVPVSMSQEIEEKRINFSDWVRDAWSTLETDNDGKELIEIERKIRDLEDKQSLLHNRIKTRQEKQQLEDIVIREKQLENQHCAKLNAELDEYKKNNKILYNDTYRETRKLHPNLHEYSKSKKLEILLNNIRSKDGFGATKNTHESSEIEPNQ